DGAAAPWGGDSGHAAAERAGCGVPLHGDAERIHARGRVDDPRPVDDAGRVLDAAPARLLRLAPASRGAVPPAPRRDPPRYPPSTVDRRPRLRPRSSPAPRRGAAARRSAPAGRTG